jgi:hypothetical protein
MLILTLSGRDVVPLTIVAKASSTKVMKIKSFPKSQWRTNFRQTNHSNASKKFASSSLCARKCVMTVPWILTSLLLFKGRWQGTHCDGQFGMKPTTTQRAYNLFWWSRYRRFDRAMNLGIPTVDLKDDTLYGRLSVFCGSCWLSIKIYPSCQSSAHCRNYHGSHWSMANPKKNWLRKWVLRKGQFILRDMYSYYC